MRIATPSSRNAVSFFVSVNNEFLLVDGVLTVPRSFLFFHGHSCSQLCEGANVSRGANTRFSVQRVCQFRHAGRFERNLKRHRRTLLKSADLFSLPFSLDPFFDPTPRPFTYEKRRGRESNPRIAVLQTATLPLGYPAICARADNIVVAALVSRPSVDKQVSATNASTNFQDWTLDVERWTLDVERFLLLNSKGGDVDVARADP